MCPIFFGGFRVKKLNMLTAESLTFAEGCTKYLDNCRREICVKALSTINHLYKRIKICYNIKEKSYRLAKAEVQMGINSFHSKSNVDIIHTIDIVSNDILDEVNNTVLVCQESCEFYDKCLMQKELCVKQYFETALCSLLPVEETIIRSMFGIMCPRRTREQIIDIIRNDTICIIDDSLSIHSTQQISEIKRKTLKKLRHPSRGEKLSSEKMCIVLFSSPKDTCYSKLWKQIFEDNRPNQELLQDFLDIKVKKELLKNEKEEWYAQKANQQTGITLDTTISDCCFGDKYKGDVLKSEMKVRDKLNLNSGEVFKICDYNIKLFQEIVTVFCSHQIYFIDFLPFDIIQSYLDQVYSAYLLKINTELLPKDIEMLKLSSRTQVVLKRAGIYTIADLTKCTENDLIRIRNLGKKSFDEIIQKLEIYGLLLQQ